MTNTVTKAVLPVAGFGTRFLPATKSVPKEILPLVDRPLIQYTIDEARAAGIKEFIFVTSRGKSALEDYFDSAPELEAALQEGGKTEAPRRAQADRHAERHRRLRPPAGAPRPRPRGLVRPAPDRRRALRGHAARRRDRGRDPVPQADDRSLRRDRRQHGRHHGGAARERLLLRHPRRGHIRRRKMRVRGMVEKPKRRGRSFQHGGDRSLHPHPAGPAQPRGRGGRRRRRDSAHRRHRRRDRHPRRT